MDKNRLEGVAGQGERAHNLRRNATLRRKSTLSNVKHSLVLLAFVFAFSRLPWAWALQTTLAPLQALLQALLVQTPCLIAERWFFFAQARHPQILDNPVVSCPAPAT